MTAATGRQLEKPTTEEFLTHRKCVTYRFRRSTQELRENEEIAADPRAEVLKQMAKLVEVSTGIGRTVALMPAMNESQLAAAPAVLVQSLLDLRSHAFNLECTIRAFMPSDHPLFHDDADISMIERVKE